MHPFSRHHPINSDSKRGIGCSHAIRSVRNIVDNFIQGGSRVTLCAIDLSKA